MAATPIPPTVRPSRLPVNRHNHLITRAHSRIIPNRGKRLIPHPFPAAVIWGEDDPFYPAALGERLHAAIPGATLEIIPGARHFVPEDSPDQLRRALQRLLGEIAPK